MEADPRVVKYIQSEINRGISKDKIVDALINVGHKHEHVKHALNAAGHGDNINSIDKLSEKKHIPRYEAVLTKNLKEHGNRDTWLMMLLGIAFIIGIILAVVFGFKAMIPDEIKDAYNEINSVSDGPTDHDKLYESTYQNVIKGNDLSSCYRIPNEYYKNKCIETLS